MILNARVFPSVVPLGEEGHASLGYISALDLGARRTIINAEFYFGDMQKQSPRFVSSVMTRDVPSC